MTAYTHAPEHQVSHLTADSLDELHRFAIAIGLRRCRFQGSHYDLTGNTHALAVERGAVELDGKSFFNKVARLGATMAARQSLDADGLCGNSGHRLEAEDYKMKAKELWEAIGYNTPAVHESNDFHLSEVWETGSIPDTELETYYKQEKDDAE